MCMISNMAINKNKCQECRLLRIKFPELMKEWDYNKNTISPDKLTYGSGKKVWWKCEKGHSWSCEIQRRTGKDRQRCRYCVNDTREVLQIARLFDSMNIKYKREKRWSDLKYKASLAVDFYLPDYDAIIEFDGPYHFIPNYRDWNTTTFKAVIGRDRSKVKYCVRKRKSLCRISYLDSRSIEEIILVFIDMMANEVVHLFSNSSNYIKQFSGIPFTPTFYKV